MTSIQLNKQQSRATKALKRFISYNTADETYTADEAIVKHNFILLGPAGSGKTTVITNVFHDSKLSIAFCAFTNKATQVLKQISTKHNVNFQAEFSTIHKMLALDIRYLDDEHEIAFDFNVEKISHLLNYDVIIFDECSTISKELYEYIMKTWKYIEHLGKRLKFIFLGDFWQLPPVGEHSSLVFDLVKKHHAPIKKLTQVMRANNDLILSINTRLNKWIDIFRHKEKKPLDRFISRFPYNLVKRDTNIYIHGHYDFISEYMSAWKKTSDIVILSYSRNNCKKINHSVQDILDEQAERPIPEKRTVLKFHIGDRCLVNKPVTIPELVRKNDTVSQKLSSVITTLYNGEIYDIVHTTDVSVITNLNKLSYMKSSFPAQLLTVRNINDTEGSELQIIHIDKQVINDAKKLIRFRENRRKYIELLTMFYTYVPQLDYGYCMSIYKSQGSEWGTVLVNLNSVLWSILGDKRKNIPFKQKKMLFRICYTAMTRASKSLTLYYY